MLRPALLALASTIGGPTDPPLDPPVRLRWLAPDDCPNAEAVRARTEALLGHGLDDPRHPPVDADIAVRGRAGRWTAALALATRDGRRVRPLRATTCEALADAAALLLAVTIDPTAASSRALLAPSVAPTDRRPTAIPESVPLPPRALAPPPRSPAAPARELAPPSARVRARPHVFLSASFAAHAGAAPGLALGASGASGLAWRRARLLLTATFAASARSLELAPGARLDARHGAVALAGCRVFARRRVELPLCAGWFGGTIRASASGLDRARPVRLPSTGLLLFAGLRVLLHRHLALALDLGLQVPVVRPSFLVDGLGVAHRAAPVASGGQFGLELRLP